MKKIRRFLSAVSVLTLAAALSTTAFAATITVNNAANGETYTAYQIFEAVRNEDGTSVTYTIQGDAPWKPVVEAYSFGIAAEKAFTLADLGGNTFQVSAAADFDSAAAADFAAHLKSKVDADPAAYASTASAPITAKDGKAEFTNLDAGYYFVTTSLGSLCILNTSDALEINEKNELPCITKTADNTTASMGDSLTFTLTLQDGRGTDQAITVYDCMDAGLTLHPGSIQVTHNTTILTNGSEYTADTTPGTTANGKPYTFKVTFPASYVKALSENDTIVIQYTAVLNENAVLSPKANQNAVFLTYSQQETTPSEVSVTTYKFDLVKTDDTNTILDGAAFRLYDARTGGREIKLFRDPDGTYRPAFPSEAPVSSVPAGQATIRGLAGSTTYWLEEVTAPAGYNRLTERKEISIRDANLDAQYDCGTYTGGGVQVINRAGAHLPTTGGIGTAIFYVVGGLLMAAAGILLVTKKKMSAQQD